MSRRPSWSFVSTIVVAVLASSCPHAAEAAVMCGDTLTQSVALDADLDCGGGAGLIVFGNDVVIDLAGRTMRGTGVGVDNTLGFERTTVKNGVLQGFDVAIELGGGTGHVVKNVSVRGGNNGIFLAESVRFAKIQKSSVIGTLGASMTIAGDDNVVTNVFVTTSANRGIAISGNRNTVSKCTVTNAVIGIGTVLTVSGNVLSGNTVSACHGPGIELAANGGTGNVVVKNRCEGNEMAGIALVDADDAIVSGNTVVGNGFGIQINVGTERALVAKNVATGNRLDGIHVDANAPAATVAGNKAHRNQRAGVAADAPTTTITKNAADANGTGGDRRTERRDRRRRQRGTEQQR